MSVVPVLPRDENKQGVYSQNSTKEASAAAAERRPSTSSKTPVEARRPSVGRPTTAKSGKVRFFSVSCSGSRSFLSSLDDPL